MVNAIIQVAALLAICISFVRSGVLKWLRNYVRCLYYLRKLPMTVKPMWIAGHTWWARPETAVKNMMDNFEQNTPVPAVSRFDMAPFTHFALVEKPETVGTVLRSSAPKNPYIYSFLVPWIGEGLLISNGSKWARNRRLLTPAFHFNVLKGYVDCYKSAVEILVQKWQDALEASDGVEARVPVSKDIPLLTLDVILRCAMSYQSNCQTQANTYTDAVMQLITKAQTRGLNIFQHPDLLYYNTATGKQFKEACHTAHVYSDAIIKERREERAEGRHNSEHNTDFLDILLTAVDSSGAGLSDMDIRNEVDTFLFEGHDTTASAVQWTLYFLSADSTVQQSCREEAMDIFCTDGNIANPNVTYQSLQSLTYIEQTIKEAMRLATTVPLIFRKLNEDVQIGGYLVPEGAWVLINLWALHHNPEYWQDPMKFDPSRFDAEPQTSAQRPVFSYAPFSAGPRNCIGQNLAMEEMKATIAILLLNFQFSLPEDMCNMEQHIYAINRPKSPIELIVKPLLA